MHAELAHRTYLDVRRELKTLLRWAAREGYPVDVDRIVGHVGKKAPRADAARDQHGPLDPDEIPPMWAIDDLREAARDEASLAGAVTVDLMTLGGLRVGEGLARDASSFARPSTPASATPCCPRG